MTEEEKKAYRAEFARSGGQAILKKRGKEYFIELGKKSGQSKRAKIKALKEQKGQE